MWHELGYIPESLLEGTNHCLISYRTLLWCKKKWKLFAYTVKNFDYPNITFVCRSPYSLGVFDQFRTFNWHETLDSNQNPTDIAHYNDGSCCVCQCIPSAKAKIRMMHSSSESHRNHILARVYHQMSSSGFDLKLNDRYFVCVSEVERTGNFVWED